MNENEIRTMDAGREMDALVAEKVMGWERLGNETDGLWIVPPEGDERRAWCARWDDRGIPDWMPHYSTDIATAWEVVEKMRLMVSPTLMHGWIVGRFKGVTGDGKRYMVYGTTAEAKTAPLAICRAALLAVMVNRP